METSLGGLAKILVKEKGYENVTVSSKHFLRSVYMRAFELYDETKFH